MCGIAGIVHYRDPRRPVDVDVLARMTRSLAHRGPDGEGLWHAPGVGFGHRRLAILDLSDAGRQPMLDEAGHVAITFNGEIYNFRELREELEARGRRFRSHSDTEVLIRGYLEWGEGLLTRISGIFAFAIHDARSRTVLLARDPIGIKPLFFADDGATVRFGSEIKAILSDPAVSREPDDAAIDSYLTLAYTPAPATGFRAVRQLMPGQAMVLSESGRRMFTHWRIQYDERPRNIAFRPAIEEFTALLERVTKAQMVSDVPVGAFLSGGLDSAAVVRAMKRADAGTVHALTVGFDVGGFDERTAAQASAEAIGVEWRSQVATLDATTLVPLLAKHVEEPTADSSMIPTYMLCKTARERFTVAMSGDGADETLAGYETYRATRLAGYVRAIPRFVRDGLLSPLARLIPVSDRKYSLHAVANRFLHGAAQGHGRDHASWRLYFNALLKSRVYSAEFAARVTGNDPVGQYAATMGEVPASRDWLSPLLHADTTFYLPNDMLIKVDRMSMACGLEVRVPLLDIAMVQFAANLPSEFKLAGGKRRKHILRESLRDTLPDSVLRLPKSGFNAPIEAWMRADLGDLLLDSVRRRRVEMERYLRPAAIETLVAEHRTRRADHAHALFAVLMLALWLENAATEWRGAGQEHAAPVESDAAR